MDVSDIQAWCLDGNGGAIGRTLLLPLSCPRSWKASELPQQLDHYQSLAGHPLRAARQVRRDMGLPIAVGFALLEQRPEEPFAHAFNVQGERVVDLALAEFELLGYWGYIPTREQLEIDRLSLLVEAPRPRVLRQVLLESL